MNSSDCCTGRKTQHFFEIDETFISFPSHAIPISSAVNKLPKTFLECLILSTIVNGSRS